MQRVKSFNVAMVDLETQRVERVSERAKVSHCTLTLSSDIELCPANKVRLGNKLRCQKDLMLQSLTAIF